MMHRTKLWLPTLLAAVSFTTALTLSVSLTACGDNSSAPPAPSAATSTATPSSSSGAVVAPTTPAAGSEATQANLQKLLDQATQYLKEGKLDLAEKTVAQLEAMKPKMTPEWQGRVDQIRSALEAAKKAAALKTGGVPTMPDGLKLPN